MYAARPAWNLESECHLGTEHIYTTYAGRTHGSATWYTDHTIVFFWATMELPLLPISMDGLTAVEG